MAATLPWLPAAQLLYPRHGSFIAVSKGVHARENRNPFCQQKRRLTLGPGFHQVTEGLKFLLSAFKISIILCHMFSIPFTT